MDKTRKKIGIVGCGAMGSAIARSLDRQCRDRVTIAALADLDGARAEALAGELSARPVVTNVEKLVSLVDIVIESAAAAAAEEVARLALAGGKDALVMSVGGLLLNGGWKLAEEKSRGRIFIPSGAVGGLDALLAIRHEDIEEIVLSTRKPPKALAGVPYLEQRGIYVDRLTAPERVFSGSVKEAVSVFPKNINVAASIALAIRNPEKLRIDIYCDPSLTRNTHEITAAGSFGKVSFKTENVPSPANPKTSHLAVLSAVATLEKMLETVHVGT